MPTSVTVCFAGSTREILPVSREATSSVPSGSWATPQGAARPVATVPVTFAVPFAGATGPDAEALGAAVGDAPAVAGAVPDGGCEKKGDGFPLSPEEHPAASTTAAAAAASADVRRTRRRTVPRAVLTSPAHHTSRPPRAPFAIRAAPYRDGSRQPAHP